MDLQLHLYLCNQFLSPLTWVWILLRWGILDTTLCDKVCQWLVAGCWFSPGTAVSSNNKTDRHDITEILAIVALNTITLTLEHMKFCHHVTAIVSFSHSNFLLCNHREILYQTLGWWPLILKQKFLKYIKSFKYLFLLRMGWNFNRHFCFVYDFSSLYYKFYLFQIRMLWYFIQFYIFFFRTLSESIS